MALRRFRLPSSGAAAVSPATQSYTHSGTTRRPLPESDSSALGTTAVTPDGADHGVAGDTFHAQFVSAAIPNGESIASGAEVKLAIQGLEAHANNNLFVQLWVGVYSNDGSTLVQTLVNKAVDGTELATALTNRFLSTTTSAAHTFASNQRLVVEISVQGSPGGGGGVQGHNASLRWGANGAGGDLGENDSDTGTTLNPWFEVDITAAATPTRGRISFAEAEIPFQATRGRVSFAELEAPLAPTRGRISFAEVEAPIAPTRGRVSWAEAQVPDLITADPTRGQIGWTELEVPIAGTRGRISFAELEAPLAPTRGRISFAELETPLVPTRARVSFTELETPAAPTRGRISFAEFAIEDTPTGGTTGARSMLLGVG